MSVQSVYVCTFCQVFSSTVSTIAHHINSSHSELLPGGTTAENFVSKLNALENECNKKQVQKSQKPKKSLCEYALEEEKMETKKSVPAPKSDGLFWCEKCHKCFNKARQLVKHICMDTEEEDNYFEDTSVDSDVTQSYKSYIMIDPDPWSKRTKYKKAEDPNSHCTEKNEGQNENKKVNAASQNSLINWRVDPSYLPVFQTEEEKRSFEKHLKSINYSFVDNLFDKKESSVTSGSSDVYFCKKCKKTAKSLSHIRMHCLIHTDIKPFTCPNCSYETNSKGSLYIHMRKHTGNMFHCSYCDFKSNKKAHVLDHEATHSTVPQICKLCKNTYKTLRSLIAHVKKYHNNLGGKRYVKSLSPGRNKVATIHCSICHKKFSSLSTFENHSQTFHSVANLQPKDSPKINTNELVSENTLCKSTGDVQLQEPCLPSPSKSLECESVPTTKDPLAELVFRNFFEQSQSKPIIFNGLCDESELKKMFAATVLLNALETESISAQLASLNEANQFHEPKQPDIEECNETLSILDECLRSPNFEKECLRVNFEETTLPVECQQEFQLPSVQQILPNETALRNQEVKAGESSSNSVSQLHRPGENGGEENKSAEIKLFEKCHRAPAYVCCVCSAIFIRSSTLKVHLKDHIDNSNSNFIEQEEEFTSKISDACSDLNNVCPMLIEPTSSYSEGEKELEKLYTSSMDMMWYLPEVSVVLENDPALFDSVLDDISNFPITDKYDEVEVLNVKSTENSVLECFKEL
ncbi:zinc finger protein Xfin-like [Uloborus diversus]|uniref:zinc finger protein Xfin-like n=1 Tax=Uloborus diversus TaxID=327109 RepID=UPI0024090428|nr:zinc finger protein Xfin-like [Uloborus diversus]